MIRYLQRRQIDDEQWNRVIAASPYEGIYPYTWYLDACADHWGGLVMDRYECIMPVAYRKKIGMKYTYQPLYCQQLGVFSAAPVDPEISRMFLHALQKQFRMGDYALNEGNIVGEERGFEVTDNANYVLSLHADYETISGNYNENCRRNIRKAAASEIEVTDQVTIDEVVALKKFIDPGRTNRDYGQIKTFFYRLKETGTVQVHGARVGDHLVAAAIFAFSKKRVYFLLSASSERGKERRAMFLVVDRFIRAHAGEALKLDFEGSNISSVARFFRGFGAKPQIYQRVSFKNTVSKLKKILQGA